MAFYTSTQCAYCRTETLWKCRDEFPEWFDGNGQEREQFNEEITEYVLNNTEDKYCLVIDGDIDPPFDEAYCAEHLHTMADMMDEGTGNLKKSKCWGSSRTKSQNLLIGPGQ